MTDEKYKAAMQKVRRAREKDASRVAAELDRRGVISDVSSFPSVLLHTHSSAEVKADDLICNSLLLLSRMNWRGASKLFLNSHNTTFSQLIFG